jgi:hypothetical protein
MLRNLALAPLTLCLLYCKQTTPPRGPDGAGIITSRFSVAGEPWMRVIPASAPNCDSASDVLLTGPPPVFDSLGNQVDTSFLLLGRHVTVWASHATVFLSCPAQMGAERIVIK